MTVNLRRNQTRVDEGHASLAGFINGHSVPGFRHVATLCATQCIFRVVWPVVIRVLRSPNASKCDELHQWPIGPGVDVGEPDGSKKKRNQKCTPDQGFLEGKLTAHSDLEEHDADDDAITNHSPSFPCRVLAVIHGVQELVLVYKAPDEEIKEA